MGSSLAEISSKTEQITGIESQSAGEHSRRKIFQNIRLKFFPVILQGKTISYPVNRRKITVQCWQSCRNRHDWNTAQKEQHICPNQSAGVIPEYITNSLHTALWRLFLLIIISLIPVHESFCQSHMLFLKITAWLQPLHTPHKALS